MNENEVNSLQNNELQNSVIPFGFESFPVRMVLQNNDPWFIAYDAADILGLEKSGHTFENFPDSETGWYTIPLRSANGTIQNRKMLIINEPGLYRLIFQSRKPEAEKFKTWIFTEVIPEIRKSGTFLLDPKAREEYIRNRHAARDLRQLREALRDSRDKPRIALEQAIHDRDEARERAMEWEHEYWEAESKLKAMGHKLSELSWAFDDIKKEYRMVDSWDIMTRAEKESQE
ncbi:hypothetical protein LQZ19_08610 [Treponema primitia]|uniref:BRO-N domain-containing protein n=1 Tax=Treponema primitia TaxID=88058 RepID=UPI0039807B52